MDHNLRFFLVRLAALGLVAGFQYLFYRAAARTLFAASSDAPSRRRLRILMVCINAPALYLAFGSELALPHWLHALFVYPYATWSGATLFLLACYGIWRLARLGISSLVRMTGKLMPRRSQPGSASVTAPVQTPDAEGVAGLSRRAFVKRAAAGLSIYSFGGAAVGALAHDSCEIVRRPIRLENLPAGLRGLRIALVSDIHSGLFMGEEEIAEHVRRVNSLKPDLILLAGDFVTNQTAEIYPACKALRGMRASHGAYACLGNHDFYAEPDIIADELRRAEIRVLRDAHEVIEIRKASLALIGVDDIRGGTTLTQRLERATDRLDPSLPSILLCHKPYYFDETPAFGIDLVVSGHTHGGQIVLADLFNVSLTPASLISRYVRGLYSRESTQMYVSRGIGTVGLPIRLNCPPEITLLEIL